MAVSDGRKFVDGSNIMLFVKGTNGYESVAHASSHTLSLSAETEDIVSKDTSKFGLTEVSRITWEISVDSFYTNDGYSMFFDKMIAKEPFLVCFGLKAAAEIAGTPADVNITADGNWTPNSANVYYGQAVISNLDWTADAGSKSTFSCTLQGQGSLSKTAPSN